MPCLRKQNEVTDTGKCYSYMHMPSFKYIFSDERGIKEVAKENLLEVLSTGEKRAYYILNLDFAWNLTEIS